ncbi:MAG: N-acetylmuramoyl-L-alanine amidase [Alphaproteobacteria bacterium]|nr:N-acetylmuramoyl-L-alanine amidase [Alphaproteobacteria bacterium]
MTPPVLYAPSPNFNERAHSIDMLVLHYTGMRDGPTALHRLQDPSPPRVSSHYLVEEDGRIFSLVAEAWRAWHAGAGKWRDRDDINSRSIGIEIVNGGHDFGLPSFPESQVLSVIRLCQGICGRWAIPQIGIVGHSDIAPDRKQDPGERFPWRRLAEAGVGFWPSATFEPELSAPGPYADKGDLIASVAKVRNALKTIGYDLSTTEVYDNSMKNVLKAFQRRWRPSCVSGIADPETAFLIHEVARHYQSTGG